MQYFSHQSMLKAFVVWSMGSLGNLTVPQLQVLSISLVIGFLMSVFSIRSLNVLLLGENYSRTMGVNIKLHPFSRICIHKHIIRKHNRILRSSCICRHRGSPPGQDDF